MGREVLENGGERWRRNARTRRDQLTSWSLGSSTVETEVTVTLAQHRQGIKEFVCWKMILCTYNKYVVICPNILHEFLKYFYKDLHKLPCYCKHLLSMSKVATQADSSIYSYIWLNSIIFQTPQNYPKHSPKLSHSKLLKETATPFHLSTAPPLIAFVWIFY